MAKIIADKMDVARREIDLAIRLFFAGEEPIGIHLLAMSAFEILKDIAISRGGSDWLDAFNNCLVPKFKNEAWGVLKAPYNFLKHANRDPDGVLEDVHEEVNDGVLLFAAIHFQSLGNQFTPEMTTFILWYSKIHPEHFKQNPKPLSPAELNDDVARSLRSMERSAQIAEGAKLLQSAKALAASPQWPRHV